MFNKHTQKNNKSMYLYVLLSILLIGVTFLIALSNGAASIPFKTTVTWLLRQTQTDQTLILSELRFPRVLAAALAGMALSVAGTYMQGMTRNALASPSLFGLTAGASASVAIAMALFKNTHYLVILLCSIFGAFFAGFIVFSISGTKKNKMNTGNMILAGAAISTLLYAISDAISLHFSTSKQMTMWASGGLNGVTIKEIIMVLPLLMILLVLSLVFRNKLALLSLDEELSISLGLNIQKTKVQFFFLVTLLTGIGIALSGSIVFIGLIVPHIVRKIIGHDYKHIVVFSMLFGSIFLMSTDLIARVIYAPYETPISAVMAIVSYPLFLYVARKKA